MLRSDNCTAQGAPRASSHASGASGVRAAVASMPARHRKALFVHMTSPSILPEDRARLTKHAFVDPDISLIGAATRQAEIRLGHLHVTSNNLARHYPTDLSNERHGDVIRRRAVLVDHIRDVIANRLATHRAEHHGGTRP